MRECNEGLVGGVGMVVEQAPGVRDGLSVCCPACCVYGASAPVGLARVRQELDRRDFFQKDFKSRKLKFFSECLRLGQVS